MSNESLRAWLRLTLIPGIGGGTQRKLLSVLGSPEAVFAASHAELLAVVGAKSATRLIESLNDTILQQAIAAALAWLSPPTQNILTLADDAYPQALLETADPPSLLYVRGRCELLNRDTLAIVGSRQATPQGLRNAEDFAASLAEAGLVIASGLALGIDAAAHRGALRVKGGTVAFVGTGIDRIYPARNRELALQIGEQGAIVSEFPLGTPVTAANFPRRNRLISGLSRGVLVVEATLDSGSQITARLAAEQGREVFAIPGSIHSPQSRGCHHLIKQGAKLVETAGDILEELRWSQPAPKAEISNDAVGTENEIRVKTLASLGFDPCTQDELAARCGLTAEALSVILLQLELDGRVASLPGGRIQRLPDA